MKLFALFSICNCLVQIFSIFPAVAQSTMDATEGESKKLDIPPEVIEDSPVLREWLDEIPNVLEDIKHDPALATLFRIGFTTFPSTDDARGINIGIRDVLIKRTGLTISADYQTAFNGERNAVGADLHYFLLPLGSYLNFAPLLGYRYVQSNDFSTNGIHGGIRMVLALSRTGGGDISVSQSFINLGGENEVGITSFSVGYGLTSHLRLSGDIERQNSTEDQDSRFGLNLEWSFY